VWTVGFDRIPIAGHSRREDGMKASRTLWVAAAILVLIGSAAAYIVSSPYGSVLQARWDGSRAHLIMTQALFHVGGVPVTLAFLTATVLFLVFLSLIATFTSRMLQTRVLAQSGLDSGQRYAYAKIAGYVIYVLGILIGLQTANVNLSSLLVLGGAVGIGVGFGLQSLANNFLSGLVLLFERPIKMGDRVEVGGVFGDVVRMAGRSTWVRTNENVVIIVPNSEFTSSRVVNWTANDRSVRFSIAVGVSYGSDPAKVRDLLLATARNHPDVLDDPAPDVLFDSFGDSALNFQLRVWTIRQVQTPKVLASDLYFAIFEIFRKEGIEIPFPQRDLHVRSVSLRIPVSTV
jgi:small-conductance mechanosensitive channel